MYAVEINGLSFSYGNKTVLDNINLKIIKGSFTALVGPNGCGKTTLLKNISGYLKPKAGRVVLLDKAVDTLGIKERARLVGYIPQTTSPEFNFTCHDVVMMGRMPFLSLLQREGARDREIVRESMEITGTWDLRDRTLDELSGGERQRVLIARALAQNPSILLMDEPVSHLDIKHQVEIVNTIGSLCDNLGITALSVLHDINLASRYCKQIIMMKEGTIRYVGAPSQIVTQASVKEVFDISVGITYEKDDDVPFIVLPKTSGKRLKVV
ncbi:MAG: ABC transporter ATP-binding protein [Bacillota bacterium]|nr:ABC transporter ATP-binding protein [Bacillota bacterium]